MSCAISCALFQSPFRSCQSASTSAGRPEGGEALDNEVMRSVTVIGSKVRRFEGSKVRGLTAALRSDPELERQVAGESFEIGKDRRIGGAGEREILAHARLLL